MTTAEVDVLIARIREQTGHDSPDNSAYYNLTNGTPLNDPLQFYPGSCIVDNNTSAYMQFLDAGDGITGRFVAPGQPGAFPIVNRSRIARVKWAAPSSRTQPAAVTAEKAQIVFFKSPTPPGSGLAVPSSALGRSTAFASVSRGVGTYNFVPPNLAAVKGIIVYIYTGAGGGTVTTTLINSDIVNGSVVSGGTNTTVLVSLGLTTGNGANLHVYPGITVVANVQASMIIGQTPTISCVVTVAALTFGVDYDLLV